MFKPTAALLRKASRLPLTTKGGPHGFYKGNRTGSMGTHTKKGRYIIDYSKVRTYVVPNLKNFRLTPFVARIIDPPPKEKKAEKLADRIEKGHEYLQVWKTQNGEY